MGFSSTFADGGENNYFDVNARFLINFSTYRKKILKFLHSIWLWKMEGGEGFYKLLLFGSIFLEGLGEELWEGKSLLTQF